MTQRQAASPAPGPLETYAQQFDDLFGKRNQREAFRRYLEGLLLPAERNKTLTALANAEPIVGAQQPAVQALQWFLSESTWDAEAVTARRVERLRADPATAPDAAGVLVIDETGDRKWGSKTAHVGRQYLGSVGKVDNGVVAVSSLWADERVYYPLAVEPFTPKQHFARGTADPAYRTKPQIALELVTQAVKDELPFRAVVADSFYGENDGFRSGLTQKQLGYVLALRPSHAWWAPLGTVNSLQEAAQTAAWGGPEAPGDWEPVERTFRDGHTEYWWALEVRAGPYGPERRQRAIVATTDPATLAERTTWYLVTNLPAPGAKSPSPAALAPADLSEVVRRYGLRNWVEQSYKQVKGTLGWSAYQVRSDAAMRRHWALVCCAFSFCWWAEGHDRLADVEEPAGAVAAPASTDTLAVAEAETPPAMGEKSARGAAVGSLMPPANRLARNAAPSPGVVGAVDHARTLLARLDDTTAAPAVASPARLGRQRPSHPAL
jgi:DDE superfamily endonuclease